MRVERGRPSGRPSRGLTIYNLCHYCTICGVHIARTDPYALALILRGDAGAWTPLCASCSGTGKE